MVKKKRKLCKAEVELALQNYLTSELGVSGDYYVRLTKKREISTVGIPDSRPFGVDIELAHKLYNWGHWKKIPAHKVMDHFLLSCGSYILDLAPERPKDADNFAMRYYKAKNPTKGKTLKRNTLRRKK